MGQKGRKTDKTLGKQRGVESNSSGIMGATNLETISVSRFVKSIIYSVSSFALIFVAVIFHDKFHVNRNMSAYFTIDAIFFIIGSIFAGVAVFSYRNYSKNQKEHLADSIYLGIFGLCYLLLAIFVFFAFGGISEEMFYSSGSFPINVKLFLLSALPLPLLFRAALLAYSNENSKKQKLIACLVVGAVIVTYILFLISGDIMKMVRIPASN